MTMTAETRTDRRVRLTLEGTATELGTDGNVLRVQYAPDASVLVVMDRGGVTVETVGRDWTPGDVVAGDHAYTRSEDGKWRGVMGHMVVTWTDAEVEDALADPAGGMQVLRYQATELAHAEDD